MQPRPFNKLPRAPFNKPAAPPGPALRSVSFAGKIGGEFVNVGDIVRCDPSVAAGIRRRHPDLLASPATFHRIKAVLGKDFREE